MVRKKLRPVLCLAKMPPFEDLLVCGVSTQLHQAVAEFDEIVESGDSDFAGSGLKAASVIRLGYLAVLPPKEFTGRLGGVAQERVKRLRSNLAKFLNS